jgi:8-oxo-dGTP pyrophosphatase MutT (NUDIX family)
MLRRNSRLEFVGGMWVFPGGRVDPEDREGLAADDVLGAARRAAVREAHEEAGLEIELSSLVTLSRWTPPSNVGLAKRFETWFFVAPAPRGAIRIDHGEIHDHAWMAPAEALQRRDAGEIEMAPPTWVTLHALSEHRDVDRVLAAISDRDPELFATQIAKSGHGPISMWHGDAGYETADPETPGPRHRLCMRDDGWVYERTI